MDIMGIVYAFIISKNSEMESKLEGEEAAAALKTQNSNGMMQLEIEKKTKTKSNDKLGRIGGENGELSVVIGK
jgi:ribosomal protein L25 (general stress protein Ctc)